MQRSFDVPSQAHASPSGGAIVIRLKPDSTRAGFTMLDRHELARWCLGPQRAVVWSDEPDAFVMLYEGGAPWASWALTRRNGALLVWDCVSFRDVGRFGRMIDALAAIDGSSEDFVEEPSNVITWPHASSRRQDARAT